MGQYERRFEERGVPAGRQTRGVPPEQQAREQELVEPEADNPACKVNKPRRLPSTRLAMADTRLVEINVACSPGAPRSSWQCPGSMPPLGLTCPDHRVRGLADFGLATGRERSSERPRGRVAVTHDLAGDPYTARSLSGAPRTTLPRATRACWAEPGPPVRPRSTYGRRVLAAMMWCRCVQRDVGHLLDGGGQHAGVGRGGAAQPDYRHDQRRGQPGPATGWPPGPPAPQRPQSSGSGPSRGGQSPERT